MNHILQNIFDEIMASPLGGKIQSTPSEEDSGENHIVLHCWDGRRFLLTCSQLSDGCSYDCNTGKPNS